MRVRTRIHRAREINSAHRNNVVDTCWCQHPPCLWVVDPSWRDRGSRARCRSNDFCGSRAGYTLQQSSSRLTEIACSVGAGICVCSCSHVVPPRPIVRARRLPDVFGLAILQPHATAGFLNSLFLKGSFATTKLPKHNLIVFGQRNYFLLTEARKENSQPQRMCVHSKGFPRLQHDIVHTSALHLHEALRNDWIQSLQSNTLLMA